MHQDHEKHHEHHDDHAQMVGEFQRRFWICLALTAPVLVLDPMVRMLLGVEGLFGSAGSARCSSRSRRPSSRSVADRS